MISAIQLIGSDVAGSLAVSLPTGLGFLGWVLASKARTNRLVKVIEAVGSWRKSAMCPKPGKRVLGSDDLHVDETGVE